MLIRGGIATLTAATWLTCALAPQAVGQEVVNPVRFDVSAPLSSIKQPAKAQAAILREHRVKKIPLPPAKAAALADTVLQRAAPAKLPVVAVIPPFPGVGLGGPPTYNIGSDPPDTNGSVGKMHYVQWVNTGLAMFDKTGHPVLGPIDGNLVWKGFGGNCESLNDGDPIALYDKVADRWLLTQFAVSGGSPFSQCVAVSTSPDPTGTYARYEYQFPNFNDYPKFGVWPDAYYGTFNMFQGNNFLGAKACAFERSQMLAGVSARMQCFDFANQGGVLPADLDGATPPPAGSPNYLLNIGSNQLNLWKFHVDWTNPASSSLTGPTAIPTAPFEVACRNAANPGECVPQRQSAELLDTLSDRLMFRLAYRKFTDHEALVVNHSVTAAGAAGVRWYELRNPGATPAVFQQGTYAPDSTFRWMGSIAMDKAGNMLLGYSVSSKKIFPGIRYTGRTATDPPNQMAAEQQAVPGTGSQQSPERWGDYASMSIDPTDDCTFWFSTQYMKQKGQFNWSTEIIPVKFTSCH